VIEHCNSRISQWVGLDLDTARPLYKALGSARDAKKPLFKKAAFMRNKKASKNKEAEVM
jgi:hypothetical protein